MWTTKTKQTDLGTSDMSYMGLQAALKAINLQLATAELAHNRKQQEHLMVRQAAIQEALSNLVRRHLYG